jgi:transcriptional regulator with XRE-family HTH domain
MKNPIDNKKHKTFRALVDKNRAKLRDAGYPDATVSRWADGQRIPRLDNAQKLAYVLDVPLASIPYRLDIII